MSHPGAPYFCFILNEGTLTAFVIVGYFLLLSSDSGSFKDFYQEFTKREIIPEERCLVSWTVTSALPECFKSYPLPEKYGALQLKVEEIQIQLICLICF